jgi:hypothetical protein
VAGPNQLIFSIHQPVDARGSAYAFKELSDLPEQFHIGFGD